ncbi:hypothetical protein KI387_010938 [Taxus chinensis]|uniref:CCHC-type domain-containing protein n=1 Tax=Taxus chinensis TaxID=29808 RepID=A0AA38FLW6_TAXCH|nr:hypothetical protein KI387_010938 [Taxus chinensis]
MIQFWVDVLGEPTELLGGSRECGGTKFGQDGCGENEQKRAVKLFGGSRECGGFGYGENERRVVHAAQNATAEEELPSIVPVWIRLFGWPAKFWNLVIFQAIGNSIGKFVRVADSSIRMDQMVYGRMCVYTDMNQPLPAKIMLEAGEDKWEHQIDYENIPFRCRFCHEYGHLFKDCPQRMKEQI